MGRIGILWNDPARWKLGENCHLEKIGCPNCASIETAYVLHCFPEFDRFHVCDQCGAFIGPFQWRLVEQLAEIPGESEAQQKTNHPAPTGANDHKAPPLAAPHGTESPANIAPGVGCFICQEMRAAGRWFADCPACKTENKQAPGAAPVQGSLF